VTTAEAAPILAVDDLSVTYRTAEGAVPAVRNVSLELFAGEVLAIVGESASGKTTVAHAILGLLPQFASTAGEVRYRGTALTSLSADELRQVRGTQIGMIFQDALAGLNPTLTIGEQLAEIFVAHRKLRPNDAKAEALRLLARVLPDAERAVNAYPFQLSGGMAQRVMIVMATALGPDVVIADEATANLDPATRLETIARLEALRDGGTGVLLITHDFGVVARLADRVVVMYAGSVVETGDVRTIFRRPRHPYTFGLLQSLPRLDRAQKLTAMRGQPPELATLGEECPFLPRCPKATSRCRIEPAPALAPAGTGVPGHEVACYNPVVVDRTEDRDN
jgi:oligopeptide/dipeptide ABC transporter ATP-binding protein